MNDNFDSYAHRNGRPYAHRTSHRASLPAPHPAVPASLLLCLALAAAAVVAGGCQVLTYTGPQGERLTRRVLGVNTAVAQLTLETDTNGLRRIELRGYQSDSAQALGTVTEAAVRAAISSAK